MSARSIARWVLPLLAVTAALLVGTPASAAATVTAEGVALASDADCGDSSLDLTLTSGDIDREFGQASVLGGAPEAVFEQDSPNLDDFESETFEDYGIGLDSEAPDGTIIGTYAYLGDTPPTAAGTAEFFVLYRCSADGSANETLLTCVGDFGTCPQTADEADVPTLDAPDGAAPGAAVAVTGVGCFDGGEFSVTPTGGGAELAAGPLEGSNGDLTFTFTMPDVPTGTELDITATCEASGAVGATTIVASAASTPVPTPPAPTPTAPAPRAVVVQPTFTG